MKCYVFSIVLVLFIVVPTKVQCVFDVPAALWNIKGHALHIKPVSAFEVSTTQIMDKFLKKTLCEKSTTLLVFLTEALSSEDLFTESPSVTDSDLQDLGEFLDTRFHMLLPHVRDPVKRLHNVQCEKEELHLDEKMDEDTLQAVSSALDRSCIVIVHLQNSDSLMGTGKTQVDTIKEVLSSLSTSKKNVIGMFTATKPSWKPTQYHRKSRNLLAEDDMVAAMSNFLNYSNCLIMYATNITITSISDEEPAKETTVIVPFDYDLSDSNCNASESTDELVINFNSVKEYPTFIIRMAFGKKRNLWNLTDSDVTIKNLTEITEHTETLKPSYFMEAPLGFSYSCGNLAFQTTNSTIKYIITFEGFQIQPFEVKDVFSSSFDCVPFFTLPIWMGLLVGILFIIILNTGVYALFAVKTMDRFDDPKGKTISVAFSAD